MHAFIRLANALTGDGGAYFARLLNTMSPSDTARLGMWTNAASDEQIEHAAELLSAGDVDGFRNLTGLDERI
jgi:hypothetical protein